MRAGVADDINTVNVTHSDNADCRIPLYQKGSINQLTVYFPGERRFGQAGTDGFSKLLYGYGGSKFTLAAIR